MSEKKIEKRGPKKGAPASSGLSQGPMDVALLTQLVQLMSANDLNTVDLRDGQKRVVLKRGIAPVAGPAIMSGGGTAPPLAQPFATAGDKGPTAPASDPDAGLVPIKSPMVGTFYTKPNPESKPFITVGSRVDEDTDVCVIEAMKVFNNIKAEMRGTIAKTFLTDGQTVEFGTVLFLVKP